MSSRVAVDPTTRLGRDVAPPVLSPAKVRAGRLQAEAPTLPGAAVRPAPARAGPFALATPAKVRAGRPMAEASTWRGETLRLSSNARAGIW